jgi:hypothetical protein
VKFSLVALLLVGLPLLGVLLAGYPISRYQEFPPVTRYVSHEGFSWPVFFALAVFVSLVTAPFIFRMFAARSQEEGTPGRRTGYLNISRRGTGYFSQCLKQVGRWRVEKSCLSPFPWWGWLGTGVLAIAWILAWSRFSWFQDWQGFTFSPIWVGYIIVINAWTFRRTGHCLMLDRPKYFLWLFPLSAAFWWYFEYLNRFVQNWHYIGIEAFTPLEYFIYATLPFSTVLPAVLSTSQWLATFPRLTHALQGFWPLRIRHWRILAVVLLAIGSAGLSGLGIWPNALFPLLWIAPLLVMASLQVLFGCDSRFANVQHGDWRAVWLPALAGLACGFLWELWNSKSLAHWQYVVPYVQRFSLFEMPILGYAGYLPFGLECAVIADLFLGRMDREVQTKL